MQPWNGDGLKCDKSLMMNNQTQMHLKCVQLPAKCILIYIVLVVLDLNTYIHTSVLSVCSKVIFYIME